MNYEKSLEVIKDGKKEKYIYYVCEAKLSEFDCKMYNVGIKGGGYEEEIEDFSYSESEAVKLCELLYDDCVMPGRIYDRAEEFIVTGDI